MNRQLDAGKTERSKQHIRVQKWDILKLFLIFLVVLGHFCDLYMKNSQPLQMLRFWIYTFHMPLFIFVTGLFSKRTVNEKNYYKMSSFLLLYLVSSFILSVSRWICTGELSFSLFEAAGVPWYGLAVFVFFLITCAVRNAPKAYVFAFSVVLACFAGYDKNVGDFLSLSRIIVFYPFFFAGYCAEPERLNERLSSAKAKIASGVYIAAFTAAVYFFFDIVKGLFPALPGRSTAEAYAQFRQLGGIIRLCYYPAVFLLCFAFISLTPKRLGKRGAAAALGSRTLQVYLLHYVLIHLLCAAGMHDFFASHSKLLIIPLSLAVTLVCSAKFLEKPVRMLIDPKSMKHKN